MKKKKKSIEPKKADELNIGVVVLFKNKKLFPKKREKVLLDALAGAGFKLEKDKDYSPFEVEGVMLHRYQFKDAKI